MIAEDKKPTTIKVWLKTRDLLKLIAAMKGETMMKTAHKLFLAELDQLKNKGLKPPGSGVL